MKPDLELTHKLIRDIESKLKTKAGKNYRGLFSVAISLVVNYFNSSYCKNKNRYTQDYTYFHYYREWNLFIDLAKWLRENRENKTMEFNFDFKKKLEIYDEEITQLKEKVYNKWINNKLTEELDKTIERLELDVKILDDNGHLYGVCKDEKEFYRDMLMNLLNQYPEYKPELDRDFREEIGLC